MKLGQWLGLSSLVISGYILWEIRQLLLLVFTAVVFATALNRLVKWLRQFQVKRMVIERN
ncbi:MAG: AI-2E family transporter, partial [cyanobacterium endosymbiont of Rhopalodia inflata]